MVLSKLDFQLIMGCQAFSCNLSSYVTERRARLSRRRQKCAADDWHDQLTQITVGGGSWIVELEAVLSWRIKVINCNNHYGHTHTPFCWCSWDAAASRRHQNGVSFFRERQAALEQLRLPLHVVLGLVYGADTDRWGVGRTNTKLKTNQMCTHLTFR